MDKEYIIDQLIDNLKQKYNKTKASYESKLEDIAEAPSAMTSRHDTSRQESSWVSEGLAKSLLSKDNDIDTLMKNKELYITNRDKIEIGSLVNLKDESLNSYHYFILPVAGGETLEIEKEEVTIVLPKAPLFQNMRGLKPGDKFEFGRGIYHTLYTIHSIE